MRIPSHAAIVSTPITSPSRLPFTTPTMTSTMPTIGAVQVPYCRTYSGGMMPETMPKLRQLRQAVDASGLDVWVQVDGGITADTVGIAAEAGANTFVAGSSVFGAENAAAQIALLRERAAGHAHS